MGRKLIIKGADFSANGIPSSGIIWQEESPIQGDYNPVYANVENLGVGLKLTTALNKPINLIIFKISEGASTSITYSIFKAKVDDSLSGTFTSLKDFNITSEDIENGYKRVVLDDVVTITDDSETLMVGVLNNTNHTNIAIPVPYQTDSINHQYLVARTGFTTVTSINNPALWVIQYGKV